MSAHRSLPDLQVAPWIINYPITATPLSVSQDGIDELIIAASASETNTAPDPVNGGIIKIINAKTVGASGTRVITFSKPFNTAGNTILTFSVARQSALLISVPEGTSGTGFRWQLVSSDGAQGSVAGRQSIRLKTQVDATTATPAVLADLAITAVAAATYAFRVFLNITADATGGVRISMAGTATATSVKFATVLIATNSTDGVRAAVQGTALGTGSALTYNTDTGLMAYIDGVIVVNAGGTLGPSFAESSASGTSSVILGSYAEYIPVT